MSASYPKFIYGLIVNPDTEDQFMLTGEQLSDIETDDESLKKVARYKLVGTGEVHHTAPVYVEDSGA